MPLPIGLVVLAAYTFAASEVIFRQHYCLLAFARLYLFHGTPSAQIFRSDRVARRLLISKNCFGFLKANPVFTEVFAGLAFVPLKDKVHRADRLAWLMGFGNPILQDIFRVAEILGGASRDRSGLAAAITSCWCVRTNWTKRHRPRRWTTGAGRTCPRHQARIHSLAFPAAALRTFGVPINLRACAAALRTFGSSLSFMA